MSRLKILVLLFGALVFSSPRAAAQNNSTISGLRFLNAYTIPFNALFDNTTVGGLSGIDYDAERKVYYLISDDRSAINPARFYTARIFIGKKGIDSVRLVKVTTLRQPSGDPYPGAKTDPLHTPDPEALRYNPLRNELVWSSEGERLQKGGQSVLEDPSVIAVTTEGVFKDSFLLPAQMHMQEGGKGPRQNGVFEGLAFADHFHSLYVSTEEPLYEDGPRAGLGDTAGLVRIVKYEVATRRPLAQYAYRIEPVMHPPVPQNGFRINGVSDILAVNDRQLLVTERSFSLGRLNCTIRLFLADLKGAQDVAGEASLQKEAGVHPLHKELLLNMDALGIYMDNIEGATFGPVLPNGHRSLIFVSDNNFSPLQQTQFLLFEVMP